MCEHSEHHGHHRQSCCSGYGEHHGHYGPGSCCYGGHGFVRRFSTREERIARLEKYLKDLQAEIKAVEERPAEIKAAG